MAAFTLSGLGFAGASLATAEPAVDPNAPPAFLRGVIHRPTLRRRNAIAYLTVRSWSDTTKRDDIAAFRRCKQAPPAAEIDRLMAICDDAGMLLPGAATAKPNRPRLPRGTKGKVIHGPLIGYPGEVVKDNGARIRVMAKHEKGEIKVDLPAEDFEPVGLRRPPKPLDVVEISSPRTAKLSSEISPD